MGLTFVVFFLEPLSIELVSRLFQVFRGNLVGPNSGVEHV